LEGDRPYVSLFEVSEKTAPWKEGKEMVGHDEENHRSPSFKQRAQDKEGGICRGRRKARGTTSGKRIYLSTKKRRYELYSREHGPECEGSLQAKKGRNEGLHRLFRLESKKKNNSKIARLNTWKRKERKSKRSIYPVS